MMQSIRWEEDAERIAQETNLRQRDVKEVSPWVQVGSLEDRGKKVETWVRSRP